MIPKMYVRIIRRAIAISIITLLLSCASAGQVANHSFTFDVRRAVPAIELLNFQYGSSNLTGTRPPDYALKDGLGIGQAGGVSGRIAVGEYMYVKWRIRETGEVLEENIDLRSRLPKDMQFKRLCFYVIGTQLYIYVIDPDSLPIGAPNLLLKNAPQQQLPYTNRKKYQIIYPD